MTVAGVDGRRGGWAVALAGVDGAGRLGGVEWHTVRGQTVEGVREILRLAADAGAAAVGVDAPMGLPDDDWRACDLLAKKRLGRGAARVFLAPPRPVFEAPTYGDAREVARALLGGRSVSAQTYGLRYVVLALDDALREEPPVPVVEVHPELSFMAMAGRAPGDPLPAKKTPAGRAAREAVLAAHVDGPFEAPGGDDHLDALAVAWSAARHAAGAAETLGDPPATITI